jgi:hypothetical protein
MERDLPIPVRTAQRHVAAAPSPAERTHPHQHRNDGGKFAEWETRGHKLYEIPVTAPEGRSYNMKKDIPILPKRCKGGSW